MKVFLSSTYADLTEHRKRAAEALQRLGQQAERMEVFGARPEEPKQASLREVEACDIFVGIYAHRYGFIPPGSKISITESEFRHAKLLKKPILCFVVDHNYAWLPDMIEGEPGRSKLAAFKAEIGTDLTRDTFTSPDDLAMKIAASLGNYLVTLGPVVNGLRNLIQQNSNAPKGKRQAVADALSLVVDIARETIHYIAQKRRSGQADFEQERELSQGWQQAGIKLAALPPPAGSLADRYFLKARFWADPESWTEERIDQARIRLDELAKESEDILLAMQSAKGKRTRRATPTRTRKKVDKKTGVQSTSARKKRPKT